MEPEELYKTSKIEDDIDRLYDARIRKIYDYILLEGESAFEEGRRLNKFLGSDLFEKLISHFESTEEYEKCGYILAISKIVNNK